MASRDTTADAHTVQLGLLRKRPGAERLHMALQLSDELRAVRCAGIRSRHPEYGDEEVHWALRRLVYGDELFRRAWPTAPCLDP